MILGLVNRLVSMSVSMSMSMSMSVSVSMSVPDYHSDEGHGRNGNPHQMVYLLEMKEIPSGARQ